MPTRSATLCAHGPGWMTKKSFSVGLICSAIRLLCPLLGGQRPLGARGQLLG
jgi:hypothetical protein